jgi:hypothetical protein
MLAVLLRRDANVTSFDVIYSMPKLLNALIN